MDCSSGERERAGGGVIRSDNAVEHRHLQEIQLMAHTFIGFVSFFANRPDRSVRADALGWCDHLDGADRPTSKN